MALLKNNYLQHNLTIVFLDITFWFLGTSLGALVYTPGALCGSLVLVGDMCVLLGDISGWSWRLRLRLIQCGDRGDVCLPLNVSEVEGEMRGMRLEKTIIELKTIF